MFLIAMDESFEADVYAAERGLRLARIGRLEKPPVKRIYSGEEIRFTGYTGERNIAHYCGYAADYISQVMNDRDIDGAVFPKTCDSTRTLTSYLSGSGKFCFQFVSNNSQHQFHPQIFQ